MNPNLPQNKVHTVVVDKNIQKATENLISDMGISIVKTVDIPQIKNSTATHPDMQFLYLGNNRALAAKQAYEYYCSQFPDLNIIPVNNIRSPYPDDCVLNVTLIGKYCFVTKYQWQKIGAYLNAEPIYINQGYSKCNICVLNENAILTSDKGIEKQALKIGIRAYFIESDEITLAGYKNGFWGGSSGLIDRNRLIMNGNIEVLKCYDKLNNIFKQEKIEPIYHRTGEMCDNGSIIPVI